MPQILNTGAFFSGGTRSPLREFIAALVKDGEYARMVIPCAGRMTAAQAAIQAGYPADQVFLSDINLPAALLGYMADPRRRVEELGIELTDDLAYFIADAEDEFDWAGGVLLAIQYANQKVKSAHDMSVKNEWWHNRNKYRKQYRDSFEKAVRILQGIHFTLSDLGTTVAEAVDDPDTLLYVNPRNYWINNSDPHAAICAQGAVRWQHGQGTTYNKKEYDAFVGTLQGAATILLLHASEDPPPADWLPISGTEAAGGRIDYLLTNRDLETRFAMLRMDHRPVKHYELYDDQEITPDSIVTFLPVSGRTALYYRDLFVHRLGSTDARFFFLMLVDGRVVSSCGLHDANFLLGVSPYIWHTFGITKTSDRYMRLGKLFMLCLTSGEFKHLLLTNGIRPYGMMNPIGIQTTTLTEHEEGKTDRSILKLISREPLPTGNGFRIIYRADFRKDSFHDCVVQFLSKWGDKRREPKKEEAETHG